MSRDCDIMSGADPRSARQDQPARRIGSSTHSEKPRERGSARFERLPGKEARAVGQPGVNAGGEYRLLVIHDWHFVDVPAAAPYVVLTKVAGYDTAVFERNKPGATMPVYA